MSANPPDKLCVSCGRPFSWRRKWADDWDAVKYCSKACRRGLGALDRALEEGIIAALAARAPAATCCPSEVARQVVENEAAKAGRPADPEAWRAEMERTRRAARRLAADDRVVWTQKGRRVDPGTVKGPVRLGRGPRFDAK